MSGALCSPLDNYKLFTLFVHNPLKLGFGGLVALTASEKKRVKGTCVLVGVDKVHEKNKTAYKVHILA